MKPVDDVARAVADARAAQPSWAQLSVRARVGHLRSVKHRLLEAADRIAACVHAEMGKPEVEAMLGEVLPSADVVDYWSGAVEELLEPGDVALDAVAYPRKHGKIYRDPRGVVAVIMPYNFPFALPLRTIVPALLAGNAVVFKPSELTPRTGQHVIELFSGLLPDGTLRLVQGGAEVGESLCGADVDLVVFTGGVAAGRRVARTCAERLVPCSLELGGKDAAIVFADAEINRAARGVVWGAMMNAGQNCASIERVFVDRRIADEFTEKVCAVVASLRPGIDVGPLATPAQKALVERQVTSALAAGASILARAAGRDAALDVAGSGASSADRAIERVYPPTVVRVVRVDGDDHPLMREETFGPVLPIAVFDSESEAVARANASRYGLTASLWTRDIKRAKRLAAQLRAGVVTINNHGFTGAVPSAPWSGQGETGWGITGSPLALDALTRPRFVLVDRSRAARELWWFPYTPALAAIARAMATLRCSSRGVLERARALFALVGALAKRAREP
ncbi:MAG TPA: aldehyde dehydrogenase family protein [Polyangiaceae bacterium]|nr:aldehyde dehydrogenase family protein [Polyangiaceae bacterium]